MLITACERSKAPFSTDDYLHVIDLNKIEAEVKFSELFASVTPIVLETTKNSLIGMITKVVATDEYIIVCDRMTANALFIFRKDGTFLHKFGHIGNGPGEYSSIADFCYDEATSTIYMLDLHTNRVNIYDIHTGSFLKSIRLRNHNGYSRRIYYHGGELYTDLGNFTNENWRYLLNKRNQETGYIEESWFDFETYSKNIDYTDTKSFLFSDSSSFKFRTFFMDGIMLFEKGKTTPFLAFTPEYTLNMGDLEKLDGDLKSFNYEFFSQLNNVPKVSEIFAYFEHKDLILTTFFLGGLKMVIYNQKTRNAKYVNLFDDLMYKKYNEDFFQYPSQFIAQDDKGLYATQNLQTPSNIKKVLENDLISENFKSTAIELANLEEDANPILLYYEFKE